VRWRWWCCRASALVVGQDGPSVDCFPCQCHQIVAAIQGRELRQENEQLRTGGCSKNKHERCSMENGRHLPRLPAGLAPSASIHAFSACFVVEPQRLSASSLGRTIRATCKRWKLPGKRHKKSRIPGQGMAGALAWWNCHCNRAPPSVWGVVWRGPRDVALDTFLQVHRRDLPGKVPSQPVHERWKVI